MRLPYSFVAALALSLGAAPALASDGVGSEPQKSAAAERGVPTTTQRAPGTGEDVARYSQRQAASPEAKQYEGGDTVVIGATTATIVLAVVLLIVLL